MNRGGGAKCADRQERAVQRLRAAADVRRKWRDRRKRPARAAQDRQVQPPRGEHGDPVQRPVDVVQAEGTAGKGAPIDAELLKALSPYRRDHIDRLGDYLLDLLRPFFPLDPTIYFSFESSAQSEMWWIFYESRPTIYVPLAAGLLPPPKGGNRLASSYPLTHWMPIDNNRSRDEWNAADAKPVRDLLECCSARGSAIRRARSRRRRSRSGPRYRVTAVPRSALPPPC